MLKIQPIGPKASKAVQDFTIQRDISHRHDDAIVSAANEAFLSGGAVSGASIAPPPPSLSGVPRVGGYEPGVLRT